jgi:energy-coupling factor transporter ATP-binding protein EcfA2
VTRLIVFWPRPLDWRDSNLALVRSLPKMDLWISGFRSLANASARFPKGVSALTGDSGTGKTTLITALHWILYGSGGSGPHKATKIQSSHGAAAGAVTFHTATGTYTFVRVAPGKRTAQPPSWLLPAATLAILSHESHSVLECVWINDVPGNFVADRLALCGTQTSFSSTAIVPQKQASQLLACGRLSQTVQEFFFPDEGENAPGTYIPRLQTIIRGLKEDLGKMSVKRDAALLDHARAAARRDAAARPLQILATISGSKLRVLLIEISGDLVSPSVVSSGIKARAGQLAADFRIPFSDPYALSEAFRMLGEAQSRSHVDWRDRARAAAASRAARDLLPDLAPLAENIGALRKELQDLTDACGTVDSSDIGGPQDWISRAQLRDARRRAQETLRIDLAKSEPPEFDSLEVASAALETVIQAERAREAYAQKAAALYVDPDGAKMALIVEEIEYLYSDEARQRQALIVDWSSDLLIIVKSFTTMTQKDREARQAEISAIEEQNAAASSIRRSLDLRAAAMGGTISELPAKLQTARFTAVEEEERFGREEIIDSWWSMIFEAYTEMNHFQAIWLADARHILRSAEAWNVEGRAQRAAFEVQCGVLGVTNETIHDAIYSEALSVLLATETEERQTISGAMTSELSALLRIHNVAIAKTVSNRRTEIEKIAARNEEVRAAMALYAEEARRLGTTTSMLATDLAHFEREDLISLESFERLGVVKKWEVMVRDAQSTFICDANAEIHKLMEARRAVELRNATANATYQSAIAQHMAAMDKHQVLVARRLEVEARLMAIPTILEPLIVQERVALQSREAILSRCIGIPAQCPVCCSDVYISDGKIVSEAITPEYAESQRAEASNLDGIIRSLQAEISSLSAETRGLETELSGGVCKTPIAPTEPEFEIVPPVPHLDWAGGRAGFLGEMSNEPSAYQPDPRLTGLRALSLVSFPKLEPVSVAWEISEYSTDIHEADFHPHGPINRERLEALQVLNAMPYPDLVEVPTVPKGISAPDPLPRPLGRTGTSLSSTITEMESILATEYPMDLPVPPMYMEIQLPRLAPKSSNVRDTARLTKLRELVAEICPIPESRLRAQKSIEYYGRLRSLEEHISAFGDLSSMAAFREPEARARAEELALLEGRLRAGQEALDRAETEAQALEAAVGLEPRVDLDLAELPEAVLNSYQFDLAHDDFLRAGGELEALQGEAAETGRRLSVATEALERVVRVRAECVERALGAITDGVNHMLGFLFEGHARYVLRADDKDRIESVLEHAGREDVDLSALSGGELDRFSIAVAAAFARTLGSPVLIFDETIASLDPARRLECVETVARLLPERPVIFVTHDPPPGLFEMILSTADIRGGP